MNPDYDAFAWYVIHTKPRQEERAGANLSAWGLEVFAPRLRRRTPRAAQAEHLEPLFPRYIFARFPLRLTGKVGLTRGVHGVVHFGDGPAPVAPEVMSVLRARLDPRGVSLAPERAPAFLSGEAVVVQAGPLKDLVGVFEAETPARERVRILLTTVSFHARVEVPRDLVARLSPARA